LYLSELQFISLSRRPENCRFSEKREVRLHMFGSSKDGSQVKYFIIFLAKNKCFIKFKNASCYQAKLTKVHASRVLEEMTQM
jgi:hypothetical protein